LLSGTSLPALARLACTPKEKTMQLRFSRLGLGLALTIFTLAAQAGADTLAPLPEGYSGHGGMSAYRITPEIYAYHYDHGFSGGDAMGWDPQLQFVWSRVAAAKACGVGAVPESAIVAKLVARYGQSDTVHEMVGIGFHQAQIEAAKAQFCTATRLDQVWALLPQFVQGQFETSAAAPSQAEATAPTERVPAAAALAASAAAGGMPTEVTGAGLFEHVFVAEVTRRWCAMSAPVHGGGMSARPPGRGSIVVIGIAVVVLAVLAAGTAAVRNFRDGVSVGQACPPHHETLTVHIQCSFIVCGLSLIWLSN
jgi:hypothetical protein